MTKPHIIGQWTCPSGNQVDAVFKPDNHKGGHVDLIWDEVPPLTPEDEAYYYQVIRLEVVMSVLALTQKRNKHVKGDLL